MTTYLNYEAITLALFMVYGVALFFLFCYGVMQIHLVYQYLKAKRKERQKSNTPVAALQHYPFVTVQLPVYNEQYVTERLIDAVARFHYPKDRFEIQVLDDSTDETVSIVSRKIAEWQPQGVNIIQIQRKHRTGYKAGALQEGLKLAQGELIAIFDADFVPEPDFLEKTVPSFDQPEVGMVQTRWDHLNKGYSLLTHMQTFLLDAHFSIEQVARNACGYFINFSGTGGIWRKICIADAGGWNSDTLTEDFDLSYRAQLKGWKFIYLEHVGSPAELPPVMSALKTQQYRWIKGIAETAKKHLPNVINAKVPLAVKIHAALHLLVGVVFVSALVCSVLSVPLLLLKPLVPDLRDWYTYTSFSLFTLIFLTIFHYVAAVYTQSSREAKVGQYFLRTFPFYLSFSMGISLHNAIAVMEGWLGRKTSFMRTPKFNIGNQSGMLNANIYRSIRVSKLTYLEVVMMLYFLSGALLGVFLQDYTMLPYHLMLAFGFGMICYFSLSEWRQVY